MGFLRSFFLNPALLFGLPLIFLPIIIHLINRQRHRTLPWGAMMFLLDAKRLQRSMAKLRYWLIMAMRMLAIAGLVFAISRPLLSGRLGALVGNRSDTVLILLDRSPSMEQQDPTTQLTKRETAINKLAGLLETTGEGKRVVLIESNSSTPEEIDAALLPELPEVGPSAYEADIPRMLQAAEEYLVNNEVGQADVWIASDLRGNDWRSEDGRWAAIRDGFAGLDGVRFHLLAYEQPGEDNFSVSVTNVRKRTAASGNELVLDVKVRRESENLASQTLPLEFLVNGARSVLEVQVDGEEFALQGHTIPIDKAMESGWGRVGIPGDSNSADNEFYFVFADEATRHVTVISDDATTAEPLRIASAASPDPASQFEAVVLPSARIAEVDWEKTTLLIWNAALPSDPVAGQVTSFLNKNKPVLFFPPETPDSTSFAGIQWQAWQKPEEPVGVGSWDNDADLLAKSQSGNALPVGKQKTVRYCKLDGVGKSLARLTNGDALLLRSDGNVPAYFYATLPRGDASSLASDGVVLYVMIQRAIEMGARQQGSARQLDAGMAPREMVSAWQPLSDAPEGVVTSDRTFHSGSYSSGDGQFAAINRSMSEDTASIVNDPSLNEMFEGLDFHKISDEVGEGAALANEVWRIFLAVMAVALIVEAALCLG